MGLKQSLLLIHSNVLLPLDLSIMDEKAVYAHIVKFKKANCPGLANIKVRLWNALRTGAEGNFVYAVSSPPSQEQDVPMW